MFMFLKLRKIIKICTQSVIFPICKSHANLIPSLFTYLNSFSSIPFNEIKGSLANGVPKIDKRIKQMIYLFSCGMKVLTHDYF